MVSLDAGPAGIRLRAGALGVLLFLGVSALRVSEPAPSTADRLHLVKRWGDARLRHAGSLTSITLLPGGTRALVSARDCTARIWDLESGLELHRFTASRDDDVWSALLLPDGERVLLTDENAVTLWNIRTGAKAGEFACLEKGTVFRLCLMPDGRQFVACGNNGLVKLWDIAGASTVRDFAGFSKTVYTAAVTPDGALLAAGGEEKAIRVWETATGTLRHTFTHKEDVYTLRMMPGGRRLVSSSNDKTVRMWDLETGQEVWASTLPDDMPVVSLSPDGAKLAGAVEKTLRVLDAADGKTLQTIQAPEGTHWPVTFSADGRKLYFGGYGVIYRHNLETGALEWPPPGGYFVPCGVEHAALAAPSGRILLAAQKDLVFWDLQTGKASLLLQLASNVRDLAVSPDGARMAVSDGDGLVQLVDPATGKFVPDRQVKLQNAGERLVYAGARSIVITHGEGAVVYDADLRGETAAFSAKGCNISDLATSPDGRIAAAAGRDGTVRLWNVANGAELRSLVVAKKEGDNTSSMYSKSARRCVFSPDGRLLLAATEDNRLLAWRAPADAGENAKPEEIRRWIADLGADEFDVREQATARLAEAGESALPLLDAVDARENAEVETRVRIVRQRMAVRHIPVDAAGELAVGRHVADLAILPDGRHWVALVGQGAAGEVVIGEADGAGLRIVRRIPDGAGPARLLVAPGGGTFYTVNRDGTLSVYAIGE
jgi:WD40 repeat protein